MVQTIVQSLGSSSSSGDNESSGFTSEQTVQEVATVLDGVMGLFGEQGLDFFHGPVLSEAASVLARYHLHATYLTTANRRLVASLTGACMAWVRLQGGDGGPCAGGAADRGADAAPEHDGPRRPRLLLQVADAARRRGGERPRLLLLRCQSCPSPATVALSPAAVAAVMSCLSRSRVLSPGESSSSSAMQLPASGVEGWYPPASSSPSSKFDTVRAAAISLPNLHR